jgi:foldase protein PrsA
MGEAVNRRSVIMGAESVVLAAALASARAARAGEAEAEGPDEVVATVNGEPISRAELVDELLVRHGDAVLTDMIHQRAIDQEMARSGVAVSEREVDNEIERQREVLRSEKDETRTLEEVVRDRYRMSMEGYLGLVRRWLLVRKLIVRRENPTEDELLLWFYRNRERLYDEPAEFTLRHVFVAKRDPGTGETRPEAWLRERLEAVRDGLVRGEDFGRLARRHSDDRETAAKKGLLGTVDERAARENLEPAFFEAMRSLDPGETAGPVETPRGYHFLQVVSREEGRVAEYEDVKTRVRLDYLEERAELLKDVFVRDLMGRAEVTRSFRPPGPAPRGPRRKTPAATRR